MEKLVPLLEKLANQLNVTVSHLWEVLVKQSFVYGIIDCIQYLIIGVLTFFFAKYCKKHLVKDWIDNSPDNIVIIVGGIILLILYVIVFFAIGNTITYFVNPEYTALERILKIVGK